MPLRTLTTLAAAGLAALAAGCGSSGGGIAPPPGGMAPPQATQRVSDAAKLIAKAIASGSCREFAPLVLTTQRPPGTAPGAPAKASECRTGVAANVRLLRGFRLTGSDTFGTGGLAEGTIPPTAGFTHGELVLIRDVDGQYRYATALALDPQIGQPATNDAAFNTVAANFVSALRNGNCNQVFRYANPVGGLLRSFGGDKTALCQGLLHPGHVRRQLRAFPDAVPVRLGSTPDLAFYGLATKTAYYTMLLYRRPSGKAHTATSVYDYYLNVEK